MPRELALDNDTVFALSEADAALGLLNGLGRLITEPQVLLGPFLTREAVASSRIEGTKASLTDVLQVEGAEGGGPRSDDIAEVERNLAASRLGFELAQGLPITQRLLKLVHAELMQGVRGQERLPGEFRSTPVWVGATDATPDTARFVPPLPELLGSLVADWEDFVNRPSRMPTLVRCALMHYQFETIHPFLDGNGRIGRLLVGLMLMQEKKLDRPLLYLSGYLESHRDQYYERLQAVREKAEIQEYLQFFLAAVSHQASDAVQRASRLVETRERYHAEVYLERSRIAGIIPLIFANPFLSVRRVERSLGVTGQGARNLLRRGQTLGWLRPHASVGRGGATLWLAEEVFTIIETPIDYEDASGATTP